MLIGSKAVMHVICSQYHADTRISLFLFILFYLLIFPIEGLHAISTDAICTTSSVSLDFLIFCLWDVPWCQHLDSGAN